jgi:transposase
MLQLAWVWLRHQLDSTLSRWFHQRVGTNSRIRKTMITALARKLLIAFWKYTTAGVVIEWATMKTA